MSLGRDGRERLTDDQVAKVVEGRSARRRRRHPLVVALDGRGKRPFAHDDLAIWGFGLQPHRSETFKLSSDPQPRSATS